MRAKHNVAYVKPINNKKLENNAIRWQNSEWAWMIDCFLKINTLIPNDT